MNSQFVEFLGKALVPFAVVGAYALFRKYFPINSVSSSNIDCSSEELDSRFYRVKWIVVTSMVAISILFALSTHAALVWLNRHLARADDPAEFLLLPQAVIWWFFPGFGALAVSYEIMLQIWSLVGNRKDADLYNQWSNQKIASRRGRYAGIDSRKVLLWMFLLIASPIGILTVLALPMRTAVRPDDIRDCGYAFAPRKVYPYAAADRMTIIRGFRDRNGKLTNRAGIVLDLRDGSRWSSADIGDFRNSVDPALITYLQKKTELPINYAETEADIPSIVGER